MKISRRSMLLAGLGLTQVGLLQRFGMSTARADTGKPTKLLTIYVPGGWMPTMLFCPFSRKGVEDQIRPLGADNRLFFGADNVIVASSGEKFGDAPAGSVRQEIRQPKLWHPTNPRGGVSGYNSNGYSWVENKLWENTCVIHGVDQGTAAHESGQISALSGAAGAEWRAPSMQAVVANALLNTFGDKRPLPSVSLGSRIYPHALDLPAASSPVEMAELGALRNFITDKNDRSWLGFRERSKKAVSFGNATPDSVDVTALDEYVLAQTAALKGKSSQQTDAFYERLFNAVKGTSKIVAADVVSTLQKTPGLAKPEQPYTVEYYDGSYTLEHGATWQSQFDLALRLLRSDLCSSILMDAPGPGNFFFDTHGESFQSHAQNLHVLNEVLGRFLGEMKSTGLLKDTLVVIVSEFSRTFSSNGHWPTTSVVMVGAGVTPNTMIGNYDLAGGGKLHDPVGVPVDLIDEGGVPIKRVPKSSDVCATVYKAMGVDKFFIPGGYGEIVGVTAA